MARLVETEASTPIEIEGKWICACGLSGNAPLCDGTHKRIPDREDGNDIYRRHQDGIERRRSVPVTLYHSPTCPYSRRLRYVLELAAVDYEAKEIIWEEPIPEWYLELQSSGTVPLLQIGAQGLAESQDAILFIDETYGLKLIPQDPAARAALLDDADWITQELLQLAARTHKGAAAEADALQAALQRVNGWISEGPFVGGTRPNLLDVYLSSAIGGDAYRVVIPDNLRKLTAWRDTVRATEAFQQVPERYELMPAKTVHQPTALAQGDTGGRPRSRTD